MVLKSETILIVLVVGLVGYIVYLQFNKPNHQKPLTQGG